MEQIIINFVLMVFAAALVLFIPFYFQIRKRPGSKVLFMKSYLIDYELELKEGE